MRKMQIFWAVLALFMAPSQLRAIPDAYQHVDQVLWVVSDLDGTMERYAELGFTSVIDLGKAQLLSESTGEKQKIRLACANLGGAQVCWIEPLKGNSPLSAFLDDNGDGAMSLVHRFTGEDEMNREVGRLNEMGVRTLERITLKTGKGELSYVLMATREEGMFSLGFTCGEQGSEIFQALSAKNRNGLKLNQYAFAIRDPEAVSAFWQRIGLPEFQINHPVLGETHYYGEIVDHDLIQGWQRHGDIAYEWCIPVKPPIVYEDHIQLHGEGIHHLAFSVDDMDRVLNDYTARGYVVSMGGTWGEKGKAGSGRYEYIDLEKAGGLTMELLWNYSE